MATKLGELLAAALDRVTALEREPRRTAAAGWKYLNVKHAGAEIRRLETALGLEPSRPVLAIAKANARIAELEAALAAKGAAPAPAVATPAPASPRTVAPLAPVARVAAPVAATPPAAGTPSRGQLLQILAVVAPLSRTLDDAGDAELFELAAKCAWQKHIRLPGAPSDAEMAERGHWRQELSAFTGTARLMRANARDAVAKILKPETKTK